MLKYLAAYGGSAVAFLVLDIIWLTLMGNRLYKPVLGPIMAPKVNMVAAVAFYLIYIFGITALATAPALKEASLQKALINGALLGFVAYATYDLTKNVSLTAGIDNLFDKRQFRAGNAQNVGDPNTGAINIAGAGAATYNEPGRTYYMSINTHF